MSNGIVILNYCDASEVSGFVKQIVKFKAIDVIVVVDNDSEDDSLAVLRQIKNKKVYILRSDKNRGYSSGNNIGCSFLIEKYNCRNIFIANPDIRVTESVITDMIKFLNCHQDYVLVAPQMVDENGKQKKSYWNLPSVFKDVINSSILFSFINNKIVERDTKNANNLGLNGYKHVEVISGAFFAIKASFLNESGLFESRTFLYNEENILGMSIKNAGYREAIIIDDFYVHFGGTSSKSANIFDKYKYYFESMLIYHENYKHSNRFSVVILRLFIKIGLLEKYAIYKIRKFKNES